MFIVQNLRLYDTCNGVEKRIHLRWTHVRGGAGIHVQAFIVEIRVPDVKARMHVCDEAHLVGLNLTSEPINRSTRTPFYTQRPEKRR